MMAHTERDLETTSSAWELRGYERQPAVLISTSLNIWEVSLHLPFPPKWPKQWTPQHIFSNRLELLIHQTTVWSWMGCLALAEKIWQLFNPFFNSNRLFFIITTMKKCNKPVFFVIPLCEHESIKERLWHKSMSAFACVKNGWNGWLTNSIAFIWVVGAVGLPVTEPGLRDARFLIMTEKFPDIAQDGFWMAWGEGWRRRQRRCGMRWWFSVETQHVSAENMVWM